MKLDKMKFIRTYCTVQFSTIIFISLLSKAKPKKSKIKVNFQDNKYFGFGIESYTLKKKQLHINNKYMSLTHLNAK